MYYLIFQYKPILYSILRLHSKILHDSFLETEYLKVDPYKISQTQQRNANLQCIKNFYTFPS